MHYNTIMAMPPDEFFERLKACFAEAAFSPEKVEGVEVKKHYAYGLQGICDLLGCSLATATRIKRSGVINAAISQYGKVIVVDADLALYLLKARNNAKYKNNRIQH